MDICHIHLTWIFAAYTWHGPLPHTLDIDLCHIHLTLIFAVYTWHGSLPHTLDMDLSPRELAEPTWRQARFFSKWKRKHTHSRKIKCINNKGLIQYLLFPDYHRYFVACTRNAFARLLILCAVGTGRKVQILIVLSAGYVLSLYHCRHGERRVLVVCYVKC